MLTRGAGTGSTGSGERNPHVVACALRPGTGLYTRRADRFALARMAHLDHRRRSRNPRRAPRRARPRHRRRGRRDRGRRAGADRNPDRRPPPERPGRLAVDHHHWGGGASAPRRGSTARRAWMRMRSSTSVSAGGWPGTPGAQRTAARCPTGARSAALRSSCTSCGPTRATSPSARPAAKICDGSGQAGAGPTRSSSRRRPTG